MFDHYTWNYLTVWKQMTKYLIELLVFDNRTWKYLTPQQ